MTEETWKIANEAREQGIELLDVEAEKVFSLCERKMEIAQVENREEYMQILFFDELLNYVFRRTVNAKTFCGMHAEQEEGCVAACN